MMNKRINDRYHILRPIGGGGMADVYLARDIILDRDVAVKVLKPQFSDDEDFIKRFRREAQAATSLSHPNVVNIYDVGEEDKLYFIVMEYVSGYTLKDYIQQKGKLHVHEAIHIMEQITAAIEHAHENHIIHRDIKPHNILIGKGGTAKVTDFGIARAISDATITHTNSVLGSVHYLSPEQARGGHVTYKSDIYSLGIVMYEMLTGQVPFSGDTAVSVAIKHLQSTLPLIRDNDPSVPQSVENVVIKATAKDPQDRYETTGEMVTDIHTVFDHTRNAEKRLHIPIKDDEATRAVPVIGNGVKLDDNQQTVEHQKTEDNVEEKKNKKGKKKKTRKFWITLSLLIAFFLVGIIYLAFSLIPRLLHVDDVEIPDDLVGMEYEEVYDILTELELEVNREDRYSDEIEKGHVIAHTPSAGTLVKVGYTVDVIVSDGIEPEPMVDVVGASRDWVERVLEDFLEIEWEYEESSDHDDDTVLRQSPEAGELIIPGETIVTITLSQRPTFVMPNLNGLNRDEVIDSLASHPLLILHLDEEQYHPSIEKGRVISQNPDRGTEIREQTEVKVIFSLGPEPEEEPEDLPITVTVPYPVDYDEIEDILGEDEGEEEDNESYSVRISIIDMNNSTPRRVVDRDITSNEQFYIPMTVAPNASGFILLYVNGEEFAEHEYTYEELKEYE
ncbi:Stk1 family PASTA domain-containing Ser/Thr kinase [Evansella cellulosilytica]|uniref:Serine/threonine-protein kinase PrkC n=1 Tax=Evansella cellulosilytica (strain ATCC 21833 / DSM 2522 / FERM P-1141 / JCM 9156 / N-4) TaxID=649639 RepID=E6TTN7_EVAC2|nr:Stk1 family PASTA domain-containing Ser/Thr kinase [Evansella cellulosilytica]ADU30806.1 serine/threonine protein kinase with PASTA sensor(s) [Evansella cellulosilytica DSM 2522]